MQTRIVELTGSRRREHILRLPIPAYPGNPQLHQRRAIRCSIYYLYQVSRVSPWLLRFQQEALESQGMKGQDWRTEEEKKSGPHVATTPERGRRVRRKSQAEETTRQARPSSQQAAQRLQYPLIKEYTSSLIRVPIII